MIVVYLPRTNFYPGATKITKQSSHQPMSKSTICIMEVLYMQCKTLSFSKSSFQTSNLHNLWAMLKLRLVKFY